MKMNELLARLRRANTLRIAVCLMSLGFVFPNALMETADAARLQAAIEAEAEAKDRKR